MEEYKIRVRKSEWISVVAIIIEIFSIIVFFIGALGSATEPIIQSLLMIVTAIILYYYNEATVIINDRGVATENRGTYKWQDIELLNINKTFINFKIVNEKMMRFEINPNEDKKKLSNAIKFVNSKLKNVSTEYDIELERKKHKEKNK